MNALKMAAVWALAKMAYSTILRGLLKNAVDDPDAEWDDIVMGIVDRIFDYEDN